jgi:acyl carrier protein
METKARVRAVVESFVKKPVNPQESLFDSGLLDSFSLPDMVAALEKEFAIKIPDSDLNPRTFDTPESIESYISKRV